MRLRRNGDSVLAAELRRYTSTTTSMHGRIGFAIASIGLAFLVPTPARAQELTPADSFVLTIGERVPWRLMSERDVRSTPVLAVRTTRSFMCLLPLALRVAGSPKRTTVTINGIDDVGACPSAVGPATGEVELTLDPGVDTLDILSGGRRDRYLVQVTDATLGVDSLHTSFTRFDVPLLQRAPINSMAFYCMVHRLNADLDRQERQECNDFVQWLADSLSVREIRFSGMGTIAFSVRSDLTRDEMRYYRYDKPEAFALMYDLLQRFSRTVLATPKPHARIEIANWRGSLISSYRCQAWQGCESIPSRPRW
jgi:hypothetical protein